MTIVTSELERQYRRAILERDWYRRELERAQKGKAPSVPTTRAALGQMAGEIVDIQAHPGAFEGNYPQFRFELWRLPDGRLYSTTERDRERCYPVSLGDWKEAHPSANLELIRARIAGVAT